MDEILLDKILQDLPELEEQRKSILSYSVGSKWKILDKDSNTYLLVFEEDRFDDIYHSTGRSGIAVVSCEGEHFHLRHVEIYNYQTLFGLLNTQTYHAILLRLEERDDLVEFRNGSDDVYIIDYQRHKSKSLEAFHFDIGSYIGGNIKIAINRTRNWIAFARDERYGWQNKPRIVACIYDLADSQLIVKSELPKLSSINALDLPGVADFLIVTDGTRKDHIYEISEGRLIEIKRPKTKPRWKISLSFAGEDRWIAERLAIGFKENGISVFYDQFEKSTLLGKDLYQYLFDVYSKYSQYCVVLISANYRKKSWTMHELKAMQSTALISQEEYILPVRLDNTELPGFPPQIGYLDLRHESIESVIEIISRKVKGTEHTTPNNPIQPTANSGG
ncbi:MAG: TIR domain-containing protein [Deltaproteobacteria bacterium]|nr:TIR domain-containing protein [Deltaproteobacteria bacterium]